MDVNTITQIVSTVGFPIAACIYMVWYSDKLDKRHSEEIEKLRQSLDNNTRVMQRICNKLDLDIDE
jgi:hypothetical protein